MDRQNAYKIAAVAILLVILYAMLLSAPASAIGLTVVDRGETYLNLSISDKTETVAVFVDGLDTFDVYRFDYIVVNDLEPGSPHFITVAGMTEGNIDWGNTATVAVSTRSLYTTATYATVFGLAVVMLALGLWVSWFKLASFLLATLAELLLLAESIDVLMNIAIGIFMVGTLYSFLIDRGYYSKHDPLR